MKKVNPISRRKAIFLGAAATATLAAPAILAQGTQYNVSSFRTQRWQDYFSNLNNGAIIVDMPAYALHFWSADQSVYRLYPIAAPLRDEFARRGRSEIINKDPAPDWAPTPSMLERDPTLPRYVPAGPENPLGTRALWLTWQYYRIHGNNDQRKIGRRASNGCIGLYNEDIEELYDMATVGTQVYMI